ncbi:MAG: sugar phosphate isomerase/epimerase family protein [Thermoproteota archaeon]
MFKLAVFTDEVSQDFKRAVDLALEFKLDGIEIRSVWNKPPQEIGKDEVMKMKDILSGTNLKVCSIASPFFKCDINSPKEIEEHISILRRCIELAKEFDCNIVRGFTFWRKGNLSAYWRRILENFSKPSKILEEEDIFLGIENEASTFIGTGTELRRFLEALKNDKIRAIWDPANSLFTPQMEKPYPDGYEQIKRYIVHVHIKDVAIDSKTGKPDCVAMGEGVIDYAGQFRALMDDGYTGYVSLETHWRPVKLSEELLNRPGGEKFSESGELASRICLKSIMKILEESGCLSSR